MGLEKDDSGFKHGYMAIFGKYIKFLGCTCFYLVLVKGSLDEKLRSYELLKMLKETDQ